MADNDFIGKTYRLLTDSTKGDVNFDLKQTPDEFAGLMGDPAKRTKVYGLLKTKYPRLVQTEEEFHGLMSGSPAQPKPVQPLPTAGGTASGIIPPPAEQPAAKPLSDIGYVLGSTYSHLIEQPLAGLGALYFRGLSALNKLGVPVAPQEKLDTIVKGLENPPVASRVEANESLMRENAAKKFGAIGVIAHDVARSATDVAALITTMGVTGRVAAPRATSLIPNPAQALKEMGKHAAKTSGYFFATTPGTVEERLKSAAFGLGYSMNPYIATSIAKGVPAVLVNTGLNMALSSKWYIDAVKNSKDSLELTTNILPQIIMDFGLSWQTRKMPRQERFVALRDRVGEFNKLYPDLKINVDDYVKSLMMLSDRTSRDLEASGIRGRIAREFESKMQESASAIQKGLHPDKAKILSNFGKVNVEKSEIDVPTGAVEDSYIKVYRASKLPFDKSKISEDGIFVVPDKWQAEGYSEGGKREVQELYIKKDAKILRFKDTPIELYTKVDDHYVPRDNGDGIEIAKYARDHGYDAVEYYSSSDLLKPEISVVNPESIVDKVDIPTKKQTVWTWDDPLTGSTEGLVPTEGIDYKDVLERTIKSYKQAELSGLIPSKAKAYRQELNTFKEEMKQKNPDAKTVELPEGSTLEAGYEEYKATIEDAKSRLVEIKKKHGKLVREYEKTFGSIKTPADVEAAETTRLKEKYPELTTMEAKMEESESTKSTTKSSLSSPDINDRIEFKESGTGGERTIRGALVGFRVDPTTREIIPVVRPDEEVSTSGTKSWDVSTNIPSTMAGERAALGPVKVIEKNAYRSDESGKFYRGGVPKEDIIGKILKGLLDEGLVEDESTTSRGALDLGPLPTEAEYNEIVKPSRTGSRFDAGFRDNETGVVYNTGFAHDINKLPLDIKKIIEGNEARFDDGFIDKESGKYYTREEALKQVSKVPKSVDDLKSIQPVRDTLKGVEPDPAAPSLQRQLFAIAKEKKIPTGMIFSAMNGIGVKDIKFVGEGAITQEQLGELITRMRRIRPLWPNNLKEFYLIHGDLPMPDTGVIGPMDLGPGGQVVNALREVRNKFAQSVATTLDKFGTIGQQINERTRHSQQYRDREYTKTAHLIDRTFAHFSREELREFIKAVTEGRAISVNKKFSDAFAKTSDKFREVDTLAKALKFWVRTSDNKSYPYKGLGEKFWPQMFEFDWMKSDRKRERILNTWMKKNKLTREQAETQLKFLVDQRTGRRSPNLEYAREFDLGGWLGDPTSDSFSKKEAIIGLKKYFMGVYARIGEATFFDSNGRNVMGPEWKSVAELVADEPNSDKRVLYTEYIKRIRGLDPATRERVLISAIRNMNIIRLLGFAQIPNIFQNTITTMPRVMQLGILRGVRVLYDGMKLAMTNPGFAKEEVGSNALQNMREVTGLSSRGITGKAATQFLRGTFFSASEGINNIVAASVGKPYIIELFKAAKGESPSTIFGVTIRRANSNRIRQMAIKEMGKLGLPFEEFAADKTLPDEYMSRAAWRLARSTQFGGGVLDLPMFWTSDYGRLITQFKTFSFNIVKHTYRHILPPAKEFFASGGTRGSLLPLVTFLGASITSGEIIAFVRQTLLRGTDRTDNLLVRALEDLMYAGTLGLWMDVYYAVKTGRPLEFIFGPAAGWVAETVESVRRGDVGRLIKQNVPFVRSIGGGQKKERQIF